MSPHPFLTGAFVFCCLSTLGAPPDARFTLVQTGAVWKYLDPGQTAAEGWTRLDFNDSGWKSGHAPFGYGRGNEATLLNYGPNPNAKPITSYFRHVFDVEDVAAIRRVTLRLFRDDAAAIYLNGQSVFRSYLLPYEPITPNTTSTNQTSGLDGIIPFSVDAPWDWLSNRNVLAVELHQFSSSDPDAWFDMPAQANLPHGLPSIEWLSPPNGSILPFEDVDLNVSTFDDDASIYMVRYFTNGALLATSYIPPYHGKWFDPPAGRYSLFAEVFDNTGRRTATQPAVVVQVGPEQIDRIVRGPYLQTGTPESVIIRWRTDWFTASRVSYGLDVQELTNVVEEAELTFEHEVTLSGLTPGTKYYYAVGTPTQTLSYGPDHYFITSPVTSQPIRIWVIGDSGKANQPARDVYQAYLRVGGPHTDVWLMLGDNAYESGSDNEYQKAVFEMYSALLPNTVLWPTIGNHDQALVDAQGRIAYLDNFTLPRAGEAGGMPSGTERYYSFDYGQIHFVCLDSSGSARTPGSPMLEWLNADLAAASSEWLIAYWHHPPYTFGTHNSDFEYDLIEMRQYAVPILESFGVDLVLCGHSHNYERSYLLQGHYGHSSTLQPDMILDGGSGNPERDHSYQKAVDALGSRPGTVYTVCGCSGEGGSVAVGSHPAMYTAFDGFGSLVIDVDGPRLQVKMLTETGAVRDMFVIEKGDSTPPLLIQKTVAGLQLSWPTSAFDYDLESSTGSDLPWQWHPWPDLPIQIGPRYVLLLNDSAAHRFFRLHKD